MLDMKVIRQTPEQVKLACRNRNKDLDAVVDGILEIDAERRTITAEAETLKAKQNLASREIPAIKKAGGDVSAVMAEMKEFQQRLASWIKSFPSLKPSSAIWRS